MLSICEQSEIHVYNFDRLFLFASQRLAIDVTTRVGIAAQKQIQLNEVLPPTKWV